MENFSPAVSVVIPLYNAEKYLSVCLESILIQTFTDFEVLLVDDCSTDNSVTIAESFLERFNGRLKIISLEKNTGSGAVPRNVGLDLARGKYVFFMDADDLIVDNALEEFFNAAETFQAEVVYTDCSFTCGAEIVPTEIDVAAWCYADSFVEEPTFETENLSVRVKKFLKANFCWAPWGKFLQRKFLVDNEIKFPPMTIAEDVVWTFKIICLAKRFLRVPTPLYVHRENIGSMMLRERTPEQTIKFRISPLIVGVDCLDEFMRGQKFFTDNPAVRLQVLNFFALMQIDNMKTALQALSTEKVYEIFLREFSTSGSSQPALISYLLTMNNLYRNELIR